MATLDPSPGAARILDALQAGDLARASEALIDDGFLVMSSAVIGRILAHLDALPRDALRDHPFIEDVYGLLLFNAPGRRTASYRQFAASIRSVRELWRTTPGARERFILLGVEVGASRFLGRFAEGATAASRMLEVDAELSEQERVALAGVHPLIIGQAGVTATYAGESSIARRCVEIELEGSIRLGNPTRISTALGHAALIEVLAGRYRAAEALLARIRPEDWTEEEWRDGVPSGTSIVAAGYAAVNRGDFATALSLVAELERDDPLDEHWALGAMVKALALAMSGELEVAEEGLAAVLRDRATEPERATAQAAGAYGLLALFRLITGDIALTGEERRPEDPLGRTAALDLAVRASRAASSGEQELAAELLARASTLPRTPLQDLIVAICGIAVSVAADAGTSTLRGFAARIHAVVETQGLNWPIAFLSPEERAAILAVTDRPLLTASLEQAFARFPSIERVVGRVVRLTPRELTVLAELVRTDSRASIASRLVVSENTVKSQLRALYQKLGARDRAGALRKASELGLLGGG